MPYFTLDVETVCLLLRAALSRLLELLHRPAVVGVQHPADEVDVGGGCVRVAVGRNYRDATPTSGTIYVGGGPETLEVDGKVEPAEE